jgi:hypothetical protein
MKVRRTYEQEREKLLKAINIALDAFKKCNAGLSQEQIEILIKGYSDWRAMAEHHEPQFRRVVSMDYLKDDVLTYFQEASGEAVEYFWKEIKAAGIDYQREENRIQRILEEGRFRSRTDYEYIKDMLVVAQQENKISSEQALELGQLLHRYENRSLRKK